jgi:hypothetical protein
MFAAEPPQEPLPYGRWADALTERFGAAYDGELGPITWFPDRTWNGRTYVPATAPSGDGEVFGYVSYAREHAGAEAPSRTSRTRRPAPTRSGRSTSPTRRSRSGAGRRAAAGQ